MPTTASRPPPPSLSLLDDCARSPSSYNPKHPSSLPSPKPASSPRTEKKAPLSPPPDAEDKRLDNRRPDLPPDSRPESTSRSRPGSRPSSTGKVVEDDEAREEESGKEKSGGVAPKPIIDLEVFGQIVELDEDETYEFSRSMVEGFYIQAEETFKEMDDFLERKNLSELSEKGHFLKGSSAAIGITKVQRSCEEIQNYGKLKGNNEEDILRADALERLDTVLARVKEEYEEAKDWLNQWFDDPNFRREHEIA